MDTGTWDSSGTKSRHVLHDILYFLCIKKAGVNAG
jgi:hypothetical protein